MEITAWFALGGLCMFCLGAFSGWHLGNSSAKTRDYFEGRNKGFADGAASVRQKYEMQPRRNGRFVKGDV